MNRHTHNNFVIFVAATLVGVVLLVRPALATDRIEQVVRQHLVDHIYEYSWVISTGNDQYHRVGVHRVVQEENGSPQHCDQAIFMVHGDAWNFTAAFLRGGSSPDSLPVFLARRGVDVWGIDLGWTLVPSGTTDFTFMRHWGLQRDIDDLEQALSFARSVRTQTGSPNNRLILLWSSPKSNRLVRIASPIVLTAFGYALSLGLFPFKDTRQKSNATSRVHRCNQHDLGGKSHAASGA